MPTSVVSSLVWIFLGILAASPLFGDEPATKAAPPDAGAQAEATKLIKDVYGREVTAAKTAEQKKALAAKILQMAKENDKDLSAQFSLLRLSHDIAARASDCQGAFAAIEETDKAFQIDALTMKAEVLRKCAATATTVDQHTAVAEQAAEVSEEAVAKDNFTAATPLVELAVGEARKAKDDALVKRLSARRAEIEGIARAYEAVKAALATLEKTPVDPDANLTVGKYDCFVKGDWTHGLPMLALGSDPTLKSLGEEEIKGVASSEEQAKLGDSWWNAAESANGAEKKPMQRRAAYWYQSALPALSGLPKDKVASRLRKIQDDSPVYLSDLQATEVRVNGPDVQYVDFHTLFKGKTSPHTIWAHPPTENSSSHRAYQIDSRFRVLHGIAGIGSGDKLPPASPLTFRIVGDGKTLWQSKPLQERDSSAPFHVNVAKVQKLEFFVDCPGRHEYSWALWIDPILEH